MEEFERDIGSSVSRMPRRIVVLEIKMMCNKVQLNSRKWHDTVDFSGSQANPPQLSLF
jgi:hypothetical protein